MRRTYAAHRPAASAPQELDLGARVRVVARSSSGARTLEPRLRRLDSETGLGPLGSCALNQLFVEELADHRAQVPMSSLELHLKRTMQRSSQLGVGELRNL